MPKIHGDSKFHSWDLSVTTESVFKVYFDKEVTLEEAIELFNKQQYADVTDTEWFKAVAIDGK